MTPSQLNKKVDQLIALGARFEHIMRQLPPELRDTGNLKSELNYIIQRVQRAAERRSS